MGEMMIKLEQVNYSYANIAALKNINIYIDKGEAIALIEPNGCG